MQTFNNDMKALAEKYMKTLSSMDDLLLIVLKGHLLIEEQINDVIKYSFPNSEFLSKINFSFFEKAVLANALCWKKPKDGIWDYIFAFNSLRNDFAHSLVSAKRDTKIEELLKLHLNLYDDQKSRDETSKLTVNEQIILSIGLVLGFLHNFNKDVKMHYDFFHRMLRNEEKLLKDI